MNKATQIVLILCFSIVITSLAGCIERHSEQTETIITKFDSNANSQWTTVIANTNYSSALSATITNRIIQTTDNGYLVAGRFSEKLSGNDGIRLIKIDSYGKTVWEKRARVPTGELFTIVQRSDNGYSAISRHGHVYLFDASGTLEEIREISGQINSGTVNKTAGEEYPPVTIRSVTQTTGGDMVLIGDNYGRILEPVFVAGLSQNGTVMWKKTPDQITVGGTTNLLKTRDGGFLLGKSHFVSQPDMTKNLIEKTDSNISLIWTSPVGWCNYSYCDNVVLGMHESADQEYEIIYLSSEVNNSFSNPNYSMIVTASLDNNGRIIRQEITNASELPGWLFYQNDLSSVLANRITGSLMNLTYQSDDQGKEVFRLDALIRSDDGGYVVVGTMYYF